MPTVRLAFTSAPRYVRTARLVGVAMARRAGVADELLDEVRQAVGEACGRAVARHQRHGIQELIRVEMTDDGPGCHSETVSTKSTPPSNVAWRTAPKPVPRSVASTGRGNPIQCDHVNACSSSRIAGTRSIAAHTAAASAAISIEDSTFLRSQGEPTRASIGAATNGSATIPSNTTARGPSPFLRLSRAAAAPPIDASGR